MSSRDDYHSSSFSNITPLSTLNRTNSSSATSSNPVRPSTQRSLSSTVESAQFVGLTSVASPVVTPGDGPTQDPIASLQPPIKHRSMTASPSVFGIAKLDHSGWSDSSTPNTGSSSNVWNARPAMVSSSVTETDVGLTASTSSVNAPVRSATIGTVDIAAPASSFSGSQLISSDPSAWPKVHATSASLGWPKRLSSSSTEFVLNPNSSPSTATRNLPQDHQRQAMMNAATKTGTLSDHTVQANDAAVSGSTVQPLSDEPTSTSSALDSKPSSTVQRPAGSGKPMPKRAPIRSATLDPSHHIRGSGRRLSSEDDDDSLTSPSNHDLASGVRNIKIGGGNEQSPSQVQQIILSPVNNPTGLPPQAGYQSPPHMNHHSQRHSASYAPFSPGEPYIQPSPYLPTATRSPDGYAPYPGVSPMLAGMGAIPAIDMSGYESYRTTPDPYAPTVPGRPIFASPGGPGSHNSTPQSPALGPSPLPHHALSPTALRPNNGTFYPGPGVGPFGGPIPSSLQHYLPPGTPQFGFNMAAAGGGPRGVATSPHLGQSQSAHSSIAVPMPMPGVGQMAYPPQSPLLQSHLSPGPGERRIAQGQNHQYMPGIHRRVGSNMDNVGPGVVSGRPPFPQHGGFLSPQSNTSGFGGVPLPGASLGWNGRFPDHRRIPTGPGGVMAPPVGFGGGPMDPGFARPPPGSGFYNGLAINGPGPVNSTRSPLLEEFRSRHAKNRKFELRDIFGSIIEFSGDQHGSRFIQEKLDTATIEEKETVFEELLPNARQLMTDVFGNYVIQKMLEHGSDAQRAILAKEMEGHVLSLSLGTYGCRVVQKAFDHADDEQRVRLAKELDGHIMQCVKDQNANHVVQKIIERVDPSKIDFIPKAFQGQVVPLASHCYSCRVLQRIFEHCREDQSRPLFQELHAEVFRLMQDQYGNYVIQWVLQRGSPRDRTEVIKKIKGQVLLLSRHKFASNVIEQVIRTAPSSDKMELIEEILTPRPANVDSLTEMASNATTVQNETLTSGGENTPTAQHRIAPAVIMMKDQFANYVLQRFLENSSGEQRIKMIHVLRPQLQSMKRFSNGQSKHLAAIERLLEERTSSIEVDPLRSSTENLATNGSN